MAIPRRKFSVEEKLQILSEADQFGVMPTLRQHNLSHSVYQRWKHQFNESGTSGLRPHYPKVDSDKRALELENTRLKKIIAERALELEFKTELLKKADSLHPRR